jgi:hypothetical protein
VPFLPEVSVTRRSISLLFDLSVVIREIRGRRGFLSLHQFQQHATRA